MYVHILAMLINKKNRTCGDKTPNLIGRQQNLYAFYSADAMLSTRILIIWISLIFVSPLKGLALSWEFLEHGPRLYDSREAFLI